MPGCPTKHPSCKEPELKALFERIQDLRATYINEQLQEEEDSSPNQDLENARGEDDDLFEESCSKKRKATGAACEAPTPKTPVAASASGSHNPERMRSIASLASDVTPTPPATPRPPSPPDFTPPPMTAAEKAELAKVLQQIALLELQQHSGCIYAVFCPVKDIVSAIVFLHFSNPLPSQANRRHCCG